MNGYNYFIDTNIFLRAIVKDHLEMGVNCENLLKKLTNSHQKFYSSSLVMAEIVWTLSSTYKYQKNEITEIIDSICNLRNLEFLEDHSLTTALDLFKKFNVKFADCLIASNPKIFNGEMTLVSYDKDFDKIGVKRVEPSKLI